jgi:hypothetical protein
MAAGMKVTVFKVIAALVFVGVITTFGKGAIALGDRTGTGCQAATTEVLGLVQAVSRRPPSEQTLNVPERKDHLRNARPRNKP